jgi:luciferase-type oxidoreductase
MIFRQNEISLGIVLPAQARIKNDFDFPQQIAIARRADQLGFAGLWVRDVPLNSDRYPDPVGHAEPWVLLGMLAASTEHIALGTAAIVLPLRHPLHVAKAALTMASSSAGRFLLGLGSGDRPGEYGAFGRNYEDRKVIFQNGWEEVSAALAGQGNLSGVANEQFYLRPRTDGVTIPLLAVGSSGQSLEWIAKNAFGWMTYYRELTIQRDRIALWNKAKEKVTDGFRALGQAMALELLHDPNAPYEEAALGGRSGRKGLVAMFTKMREMGVHHVALNIVSAQRPVEEVMDEIASDVLPALL